MKPRAAISPVSPDLGSRLKQLFLLVLSPELLLVMKRELNVVLSVSLINLNKSITK